MPAPHDPSLAPAVASPPDRGAADPHPASPVSTAEAATRFAEALGDLAIDVGSRVEQRCVQDALERLARVVRSA